MSELTAITAALGQRLRGQVIAGHPLAAHTTYRIGGPADLSLFPLDVADLVQALALLRQHGLPHVLLGGGSNVLVSDRGVRGAVVITTAMQRVEIEGTAVVAEAGAASHDVALAARDAGLSGLEFLTSLPGSIGGACMMNARAYGGEMSGVLVSATVITREGTMECLPLHPGLFAYKRSPFAESGAVVAQATLGLAPGEAGEIRRRMETIAAARQAKHELDHPSCGCVFKNDPRLGESSGALIERCGLKGYRVGDAQISLHHANFILNLGQATAEEVQQVIAHVRHTVAARTGHRLELEVQLLGETLE